MFRILNKSTVINLNSQLSNLNSIMSAQRFVSKRTKRLTFHGGALVSTGIVGGMVSEPRTLTALKRGT